MAPGLRGSFAVYLVDVPPEFQPHRPWELPESFTVPACYARNLPLYAAAGFVFTFNRHAMGSKTADRQWAFVAHGKVANTARTNLEASRLVARGLLRPADFKVIEHSDGGRTAHPASVAQSRVGHYLHQGKVVTSVVSESNNHQHGKESSE